MRNNEFRAGAVLSYLRMLCSIVIGFLYTPVMIRLLGQSEYGLYNAVASVTAMLSVLNLGFGSGYQRYYSRYKQQGDTRKQSNLNGMFLSIFLALGAAALLCGIYLYHHLDLLFDSGLSPEEYTLAKKLLAMLILQLAVSFPTSVFGSIIHAHERFTFGKLLALAKTLLSPMITLPLLLMGYRSAAVVAVSMTVSLVADGVQIYYVLFVLKEKFTFGQVERGLFWELFGYIFFIALHLITDQINWNVDKILLARYRGTEAVAVYSAGYSLYSYFIYLGTPISTMFIPKVHRIAADTAADPGEKRRRFTHVFVSVGRIQYLVMACVASGVVLFGRAFMNLWIGEGYSASYWVALLLILPGTIDLIQVIGTEIQRAQNLHRFRGIVYILMAVCNVMVSIPLCIRFGPVGCAGGTAVSLILVQGVIINVYLHKRCNVDVLLFWKQILKMSGGLILPLLVGFGMTALIRIETWTVFFCLVGLYCAVYAGSMWLFAANEREKEEIRSLAEKLLRRR